MIYSFVDCAEEHGSATYQEGDKEKTASVVLRCDWNNAYALIADIVANRRAWPPLAGWTHCPRAKTATIKPGGDAGITVGQGIDYIDALVTVNYTTEETDLINESLEPSAEFMVLDYKRFRWGSGVGDPLLEGEAPGKLMRGLALVRTMYKVAPPLPIQILSCTGGVNSASYTSALLNLTFPAETLLYQPPSLQRKITTAGDLSFDITLKFMYKPEGWNKFWRQKTQTWSRIYQAGSGTPYYNYPLVSFGALLA